MALYTILLGISIFMIALVIALIKKVFFRWKEEHKIERMCASTNTSGRPAVGIMIYADKCVIKHRRYEGDINVFDIISKSDISLTNKNLDTAEAADSNNNL